VTAAIVTAAVSLAAITGFVVARRWRESREAAETPTDTPRKSLRGAASREGRIVGRTVTIARPRQEVYAQWRDFTRFPEFMEDVTAVERLADDTFRWTVKAPAGREVTFDAQVVEDRPGELLAWHATDDAAVRNSGKVTFRDAPGGRGTQVDLTLVYDPPGGRLGELVAFLFQREPQVQARRNLRRFKQLMEAGEVAIAPTLPVRPE
jgi:uncharacterized membrane protein